MLKGLLLLRLETLFLRLRMYFSNLSKKFFIVAETRIYTKNTKMLNLEYLKNLNEKQKEAVLSLDGPLLIVAGAGSGKTKVLISRMAHIIEKKKAYPNQILAVTFTNKAAKEMQNRISKILKKEAVGIPWLGTFHSVCAKLLRKHAKAVNLNSNFTIIDQDDQIKLIKNIS